MPIQAAYLYDAVMIYARALTEVFENNEDPRNGTAILKRIVNRSYHSVQGTDVSYLTLFVLYFFYDPTRVDLGRGTDNST